MPQRNCSPIVQGSRWSSGSPSKSKGHMASCWTKECAEIWQSWVVCRSTKYCCVARSWSWNCCPLKLIVYLKIQPSRLGDPRDKEDLRRVFISWLFDSSKNIWSRSKDLAVWLTHIVTRNLNDFVQNCYFLFMYFSFNGGRGLDINAIVNTLRGMFPIAHI